jgi:Ca-activated chloride channel homolog
MKNDEPTKLHRSSFFVLTLKSNQPLTKQLKMKVNIEHYLSDNRIDSGSRSTQRQLTLDISAMADYPKQTLPLNLCLVIDCSGSMAHEPIETVKQAAISIIEKLQPGDRIAIIAFNHKAKAIVPNQTIGDLAHIKQQINLLVADGGTAIDEGLKLGIKEISAGKRNAVSHIFLLTDGENEHGDNKRCLKLAKLASEYKITINTLGFGEHWNQDVLEKIADSATGTLAYIEEPEKAITEFEQLFTRLQSVGLTDARLTLELMPQVRLAELKPIAQVSPETIELPLTAEGNYFTIRLGDVMRDRKRTILINLYISQLPPGKNQIAAVQVSYDAPAVNQENVHSSIIAIEIEATSQYQPELNPLVQKSVLTLAKYRQTQIAEDKLRSGDTVGAATMLQTAAKTALQLGDETGATVLQQSATRLQVGEELSEVERKKTRLASKTIIRS